MLTIDYIDYWMFNPVTISNKASILPDESGVEPSYIPHMGWQGGYSFRRFLGNVLGYLDEAWRDVDGIQQLIHHYYLQNGELGARVAAQRMVKFLGGNHEQR